MRSVIAIDHLSTTAPATKYENGATGWELALVTARSLNETITSTTKLVFAQIQACLFFVILTPKRLFIPLSPSCECAVGH